MFVENPLGVHNTLSGATPSAVLWIISPRNISQQVKRPMLYHFGPTFVEQAEEAVARMAEQRNRLHIDMFTRSPMWMHQSVVPSATPSHVLDMRHMSQLWTFMLIVNNDKVGAGGAIRRVSDCQHLYYGVFLEEPVNPVMHMGQHSFNPQAAMMITHKTLINRNTTVGGLGQQQRLDVMADYDVVHPQLIETLSMGEKAQTLLRPEDLYPSTTDDRDMVVMYGPGSLLEQQGNPVPITSSLTVPRHNVSKILSGVADARSTLVSESVAGRLIGFDQDTYRTIVDQNLRDNAHGHDTTGLQVNTSILLGAVMNRYNPKCEIVPQDRAPRYNPIDQYTTSARNSFSSMLTMVVPAIMSEYMLAEISFRYDSYNNVFQLNEGVAPASLTPMSHGELSERVRGFIFRLTQEILPIPKLDHGDYVLFMSCTCCGVTHINLNFLDMVNKTDEVFEVPTILGGINSSLIGDATAFHNNARELTTFINTLVQTDTDRPALSQYDNAHFNRGLLEYDQQQGTMFGSPGPSEPMSRYRC